MKKKKHAEHENLERWLISYADFITLMFAFFVVLWSMRSDTPPNTAVIEGIKHAFNPFGERTAAQETVVSIMQSGASEAIFTVEPMYQNIEAGMKKVGIKGVTIHKVDRGVILRIPDEALFEPGQAEIRSNFFETLTKTGSVLHDLSNQIQVEGHTDNVPIKTALYPSNWELSTARATAIVRYFIEKGRMPPQKFAVAGYSEYHPLVPNDTPAGRAKNRRVDIVVVKEEHKAKPAQTFPVGPEFQPLTSAAVASEKPSR